MTYTLVKEHDGEFGYLDQDGVSHNSPNEWLWVDIMGGCGCGSMDLPDRARRVFDLFSTPMMKRKWTVYDDRADEILAHWLDHAGLLEHGTSVAFSWLNEKGEEVRAALDSLRTVGQSETVATSPQESGRTE